MLLFAQIIGILTVTFSFLAKVIGQPDQMRRNYKRKSTEGVSTILYIIAFLSYTFYTIHGILQKDWVIIAGQSVGVITSGIILGQIIYYKQKDSSVNN